MFANEDEMMYVKHTFVSSQQTFFGVTLLSNITNKKKGFNCVVYIIKVFPGTHGTLFNNTNLGNFTSNGYIYKNLNTVK